MLPASPCPAGTVADGLGLDRNGEPRSGAAENVPHAFDRQTGAHGTVTSPADPMHGANCGRPHWNSRRVRYVKHVMGWRLVGVGRTFVALVLAVGLTACIAHSDGRVAIDWVPFVYVNGRNYVAVQYTDRPTPVSALGAVVATVRHKVEGDVTDPHYRSRNGDAAFLSVGTRLRAVEGFARWFRIAAVVDGNVTVFQLDRRSGIGAAAFDLRPRSITALEIRSGFDGSVRNRVVDQALVEDLVTFLRRARLHPRSGGNDTLTCFISLAYTSTPPVTFGYDPATGFVYPGFRLPTALRQRLARLGCA